MQNIDINTLAQALAKFITQTQQLQQQTQTQQTQTQTQHRGRVYLQEDANYIVINGRTFNIRMNIYNGRPNMFIRFAPFVKMNNRKAYQIKLTPEEIDLLIQGLTKLKDRLNPTIQASNVAQGSQ